MKDSLFKSALADRLAEYIELRRSFGFELHSQIYTLGKFDRVVQETLLEPGPVTRQVVEAFMLSLQGLQPLTRRVQLSTIRQFLLYLRQFEPQTFVPDRSFSPAKSSPRAPYIYSEKEIRALLHAALQYPARYPSRRGLRYYTLIGLLYVSALRISEALALTLADVDLQKRILRIRKAKFHKARLVPFTESSSKALVRYLKARAEDGHSTAREAPLFVTDAGDPLPYSTVLQAFRKIKKIAGLCHKPSPRLHDLRHTAAVTNLHSWYREGDDLRVLLPVLSTYLGHSRVWCTEIYLTATEGLLEQAGKRLERHIDTLSRDENS
jgi:integrase